MPYSNTGGAYQGNWPQHNHGGHNSGAYSHASGGYPSRSSQSNSEPGVPYHPQSPQDGRSNSLQYSYGGQVASARPYVQETSVSTGAYPPGYQAIPYDNAASHYSQAAQPWTYAQQSPVVPASQDVLHSRYMTSPVAYASPQLPLGASRMNADTSPGYNSSSTWSASGSSIPGSSSGPYSPGRQTGSAAEYVVPCPYDCGTVLTGVHAVGNMTRHLKSQNCIGSGKEKTKYVCPMPDCEKRYIRSDGLKVHLRKRHNISHVPERNGSSEHEEGGYS